MGNAKKKKKKNVKKYPKTQGWSAFAFIRHRLLFKKFTDLR